MSWLIPKTATSKMKAYAYELEVTGVPVPSEVAWRGHKRS